MTFGLGDRVRWATTDDDGLPVVRYGFVGGAAGNGGPVVVMLDGELAGEVIDLEQLEPVSITNVELHLDGPDLIDDPNLRRGLVHLWQAEAETAGLDVDALEDHGPGERLPDNSWTLGALSSGGEQYLVRASRMLDQPNGGLHPGRALPLLSTRRACELARSVSPNVGNTVSSDVRRSWPCPGRRRRTSSPGRTSCPRPAGRGSASS